MLRPEVFIKKRVFFPEICIFISFELTKTNFEVMYLYDQSILKHTEMLCPEVLIKKRLFFPPKSAYLSLSKTNFEVIYV